MVGDCNREENPVKCANCGKGHAANNRLCPAFRREARKRGIVLPPPPPSPKQRDTPKPRDSLIKSREHNQKPTEIPTPKKSVYVNTNITESPKKHHKLDKIRATSTKTKSITFTPPPPPQFADEPINLSTAANNPLERAVKKKRNKEKESE